MASAPCACWCRQPRPSKPSPWQPASNRTTPTFQPASAGCYRLPEAYRLGRLPNRYYRRGPVWKISKLPAAPSRSSTNPCGRRLICRCWAPETMQSQCWLAPKSLGWSVTVADQRPAYLENGRFAGADRVCALQAADLAERLEMNRFSACVVMSHNIEHDQRYLAALAGSEIPCVGLLGPARRRQGLLDSLPTTGGQFAVSLVRAGGRGHRRGNAGGNCLGHRCRESGRTQRSTRRAA